MFLLITELPFHYIILAADGTTPDVPPLEGDEKAPVISTAWSAENPTKVATPAAAGEDAIGEDADKDVLVEEEENGIEGGGESTGEGDDKEVLI